MVTKHPHFHSRGTLPAKSSRRTTLHNLCNNIIHIYVFITCTLPLLYISNLTIGIKSVPVYDMLLACLLHYLKER